MLFASSSAAWWLFSEKWDALSIQYRFGTIWTVRPFLYEKCL
jgi:hypothetical protein